MKAIQPSRKQKELVVPPRICLVTTSFPLNCCCYALHKVPPVPGAVMQNAGDTTGKGQKEDEWTTASFLIGK